LIFCEQAGRDRTIYDHAAKGGRGLLGLTHDRPLGGFLLEVVRGGKSKGLERSSHFVVQVSERGGKSQGTVRQETSGITAKRGRKSQMKSDGGARRIRGIDPVTARWKARLA
jgi:hypothetical protein